jgi:zinc/manganese transport system substrate-binding protein
MVLSRRALGPRARRAVPGLIMVLGAAACGGGASDEGAAGGDATRTGTGTGPYVVATTTVWADVAGAVACDGQFEIRTLVPPGGDAHAYEPSLRDRETLDGAALVVANGLGLEELLDDTLETVAATGVPVVRIGELPELGGAASPAGNHDDGDAGHGHERGDPHVWVDPMLVRAAVAPLGEAMVAAGADAPSIKACARTAEADLDALDAEVEQTLATVEPEHRVLVTNHDSLGPFADRYGFEILGSVLGSSSTLTEASPADLEALGAAIERVGAPAIFAEVGHGRAEAEALAERLGVELVELSIDSLGEPGSGVESYADMMRTNARAIAAALGG